ncbi:MurR/RpiR family transcriptional regulator [Clostridioides sp. ES-S-0108-01]|uniref:MurR/RpiR family transcriptional regulator n=1 Tax=unclassified Clostridioides TaxID=2635829 RepID=UPI001D0C46B1|nr:MurR/RpiR family transcriptional regulator [Clostridioides sp. ES-S-0171-01]MCC0688743.1 MurR/RpiR family transcriptional regulator [Clostridioides sp. ES-S-0056-01]MCC0716383.1 MurR/RpiR family transcriptional regulator [Clostridioides sp. ES-S-0077-01]MCC0782739.1 MurR/RpiR family transcriptional regulator [Clostridioides sp. ES-S-0108-01]UDN50613.1 MurR/RpiR family transcriptional regulator [Clostridioides sp. ES-S-0107-01]UDN54108.1 MurR/RpiR family transcriptional regulator [Clostridio
MSCILKLKQIYEDLTEVDKKIADYILDNTETISKLSVSELASNSKTSTASIVRFSRKMGYSGFGDLKIEIAKDLIGKENDYTYVDENYDCNIDSVINKITNKNIETINQTRLLNEKDIIKEAVEQIIKAKNIYIFGVGGSALVALDLQMKLLRINKQAFTSLDSHTQLMVSSNVEKEDIAIAISYSGESKEVIKSIENAKLKGCKVICITKYSDNHLSKISDLKLVVPNIEKRLREGAISSRIAMLTLIDIIYISIIQENLNEAEQKLLETRRILDYLNIDNA